MGMATGLTTSRGIRRRLQGEIERGRWRAGEQLPSYQAISELLGGSPGTVMKAVNELEQLGLLTRLSPRRIAVAERPSATHGDLPVGIVSLTGHVFEDMAHTLVKRLYDRQVPSSLIDPLGDSDAEVRRWFARFFSERYRALVIRDNHPMRTDLFAQYRDRFDRLILIETPFNDWPIPYHGIFIDRAFLARDALKRLAGAGCDRLHVLVSPSPPGARHPRDEFGAGMAQFGDRHLGVETMHHNPYDLASDERAACEWVTQLRPGDGVFACSDWFIILAQQWLHDFTDLDIAGLRFVGAGNTPWSQHGVHRFASYDYRPADMIDQVLEWLEIPANEWRRETVIRRLRPRLVRPEQIRSRR